MTDDWSPPTGEHDRPPSDHQRAEPPTTPAPNGEVDPVFGLSEADLRMVDAFYYELAMDAANDPSPPTAAEQVEIKVLAASFERLKAMSPEELLVERARRLRARRG